MKMSEVDLTKVTPMMRHYIDVKKENPDVIIFYRLGDFYEVFYDDAPGVILVGCFIPLLAFSLSMFMFVLQKVLRTEL